MDRKLLTRITNSDKISSMDHGWLDEPIQDIYYFPSQLTRLADEFEAIYLDEMQDVTLQDRVDTKYLLTSQQLLRSLKAVHQDYRILSVQGNRFNHYHTLYFDTPEFTLYHLHINNHADCYKVRSREYVDSQQSFLEVKHKNNKGRTCKERLETEQPLTWLTFEAENWLDCVFPLDGRLLEPKLWNYFTRLTLVNQERCERVTLDVDLVFSSTNKSIRFNNIAIAEVKQQETNQHSTFATHMKTLKVKPQGFSKYCMGVSLLFDNIKKNSLKPKLLKIEKMIGGNTHE